MANRDYGPTYISWRRMRQRVGHRIEYVGVTIDPSWNDFRVFLADMGERPEGKTLGRMDNNRGYCKENCRWETAIQQARNRKSTSIWGPYVFMEGRKFRFEIKRLGVLKFFNTAEEAMNARDYFLGHHVELS